MRSSPSLQTLCGRLGKILTGKVRLYGRNFFSYGQFFFRGTNFLAGTFNDKRFACHAKSGGQSLWLPYDRTVGLKVFHPKGFSAGLEKATGHFHAQSRLAEAGLAPKTIELYEVEVRFVKVWGGQIEPWDTYGITMERVLNGGINNVLANLGMFGVSGAVARPVVEEYLKWHGSDGLSIGDYINLARYFGADEQMTQDVMNRLVDIFSDKIPTGFSVGPDLLSWTSNLVLDEDGEVKAVDCDLAGV